VSTMPIKIRFTMSLTITGTFLERGLESGRGPRKEIAMKILVTGATGTVGSEVVKALLQRGAQPGCEVQGEPHGGYRHV